MHTIRFSVPELENKVKLRQIGQTFRDNSYLEREQLRERLIDKLPVQILLRDEPVGSVYLDSIQPITSRDLSDEDVRVEGFSSFEEMVSTMRRKKIYPDDDRGMNRIRFHWI